MTTSKQVRLKPDTTGTRLKPDIGTGLTHGIHQPTSLQLTKYSSHCRSGGTESSAASAMPVATCGRIPIRT
jgi:hypothetical protein